jgi:hypothetical protein
MKSLEEKKLLVKMAKAFGQPVDQALVESIEREERLAKILFKEEKKQEPKPVIVEQKVLVEADPVPAPVVPPPPPPVPAFTPPTTNTVIDVVNVLKTANANNNIYRDKELDGMRRTIAEMMQKISTMSWGGGGTGIVRIWDADDFVRSSAGNGKYMKYQDGWFVMDEINPYEVVHNTTLVSSNTYVVTDSDYYIGVNVPEYTTIILPLVPSSGRMVIIKDESGNAQRYPIKLDGNIDNDPGGAEIRINNGGVQLIYRNGWRIV